MTGSAYDLLVSLLLAQSLYGVFPGLLGQRIGDNLPGQVTRNASAARNNEDY